jgi:hypothetical protein
MLNYYFEIIANQKKQEIEQNASEAWKLACSKGYSTIPKIMKLFKVTPKQVKSNGSFDTCVSCNC